MDRRKIITMLSIFIRFLIVVIYGKRINNRLFDYDVIVCGPPGWNPRMYLARIIHFIVEFKYLSLPVKYQNKSCLSDLHQPLLYRSGNCSPTIYVYA